MILFLFNNITGVGVSKSDGNKANSAASTSAVSNPPMHEEDPRPPDDYNEPWDNKAPRPVPPANRKGNCAVTLCRSC